MKNKQLSIFFEKLKQFVEDKELIKLVLSNKRDEFSDLKSIIATIVKLKAGYRLNIVYRHNTKDITKNYPFDEGLAIINEMYIILLYEVKEVQQSVVYQYYKSYIYGVKYLLIQARLNISNGKISIGKKNMQFFKRLYIS